MINTCTWHVVIIINEYLRVSLNTLLCCTWINCTQSFSGSDEKKMPFLILLDHISGHIVNLFNKNELPEKVIFSYFAPIIF